ncbi:MAG TPA: M56 family metallopeptidase [Blastocatellia bacterium]|nr:M56 family metallopeptidase [Blastocatellia bacterium]
MISGTGSVALVNALSVIGEAAIRSIALAVVVALILYVVRVRNIRFTLMVWTGVLYAALAMPLLSIVLPRITVPMPDSIARSMQPDTAGSMSARDGEDASRSGAQRGLAYQNPDNSGLVSSGNNTAVYRSADTASGFSRLDQASSAASVTTAAAAAPPAKQLFVSWSALAGLAYLAVVFFMLIRLFTGLILSGRLRRSATGVSNPRMFAALKRASLAITTPGAGAHAAVAESSWISVPVTIGVVSPVILLPMCWPEWESEKLEAVLAHELSHIHRRDGLTQLLSAVHRSIFWFSPLSWWLHRRLLELAEEASDDSALLVTRNPTYYAEVLLGFFDSLSSTRGRWLGVSMAQGRAHGGLHGSQASRRVDRILNETHDRARGVKRIAAVAILVLAIPAALLAASVSLGSQSSAALPPVSKKTPAQPAKSNTQAIPAQPNELAQPPEAPQAPAEIDPVDDPPFGEPPPAPSAPLPPNQLPGPPPAPPAAAPPEPPVQSMTGIAPIVPTAPEAPPAPLAALAGQAGSSWISSGQRGDGYVIVTDGSNSMTMSGSMEDVKRARALKAKIKGSFIWFTLNGRAYVITDQAMIKTAKELFRPEDDLSRQQDELSAKQDELSRQQDELSEQQERVRVDVPDMTAEFNALAEKMKGAKTQSELSELQQELSRLQSRLSDLESRASRAQSGFGYKQSELGRRQAELGQQQAKLGAAEARVSRDAYRKLRQMLEEAVRNGTAQPEP